MNQQGQVEAQVRAALAPVPSRFALKALQVSRYVHDRDPFPFSSQLISSRR